MFDTNIYGFLIKEPKIDIIEPKLIHNKNLVIYGCAIIRKELRAANDSVRILLLELYDHITRSRDLDISDKAKKIANEYYLEAKVIGKEKIKEWNELENDLLIIAIASINDLDIVFSADKKTMFGEYTITAYQIVNLRNNLRSPNLLPYETLKDAYG